MLHSAAAGSINIQYGTPIHPAPSASENAKCGNSRLAETLREGHRKLTVPLCPRPLDVTAIDSRCGKERSSTVLLPTTARSTRSNQSMLLTHMNAAARAIAADTIIASRKARDILGVVTGTGRCLFPRTLLRPATPTVYRN